MKNVFSKYIDSLQASVISSLEQVDGLGKFKKDSWSRIEGGGGLTMVLENGNVFEKGGVNVSKVHGKLPESMSTMLNTKDSDFYAADIKYSINKTSFTILSTKHNVKQRINSNLAGEHNVKNILATFSVLFFLNKSLNFFFICYCCSLT